MKLLCEENGKQSSSSCKYLVCGVGWLVGWRKNAFCQYWVVTGCLNILNIGFGHENSVQIWILSIFLCTSSSFEFSWCRDKFLSWPLVHIPPTLMQTGPSNAKFSVFDYWRWGDIDNSIAMKTIWDKRKLMKNWRFWQLLKDL